MRNANYPSDNALTDNIHSRIITSGIWGRGDNLVTSDDSNTSGGNIPASEASQRSRERQILERLLTFIDTTDACLLTNELLDEYGSFNATLSASSELTDRNPVFAFLAVVQQALVESSKSRMIDRVHLTNASDVIEYLVIAMAHLPVEEVRVLFLDAKNRLIRDEATGRGSVSEAPIYPREILKRSLTLGATGLILAHNHPSGDPEPSDSDIKATYRLAIAGKEIGVLVHDHIVVGRCGWVSMRDRGQI